MINIFLITFIIVFIIDLSGFIDSIKTFIQFLVYKIYGLRINEFRIKPFDCSLCMSFWTNIIYIYIINEVTILNIAFISICAFSTRFIYDFVQTFYNYINKLLIKLT